MHCHPSSELCRRCLAAASLLEPVGGCSLSIMAINSSAGRSLFPISACPLWFSLRRCTVSSDCGCAVLSYVLCPMWPPCCRRRPVETFRPCAPQGVHAAAYPTKRPPSEITSERRTDHNPHTRCAGIRLDLEHRGVPGVLGSPAARVVVQAFGDVVPILHQNETITNQHGHKVCCVSLVCAKL